MEIEAFNKQVRISLRKINLKQIQQINRCIRPLGITPSQMMILFNLDEGGTMNISELEERTEMPKSNVSAICGRLEESGCIKRRRDEKDQRIVYISLTEKAKKLIQEAKTVVDFEQNRLAKSMNETEREQILNGLSLLVQMYENSTNSRSQKTQI